MLGGAAAAVVLTVHPFSHNQALKDSASTSRAAAHQSPPATAPAAGPATAVSSPSSPVVSQSASPAGTQVTEQQAAQNLAGMLSQSGSDRTAIRQAYNDVQACGPSLASDPQVFEKAADSRRALLAQLSSMPGASALPAPMLQDLTSAWQASIATDQDYAQWANDEISQGCSADDSSDRALAAANGPGGPNDQATADKQDFVSLWNPIAAQYGLSTYTSDQF